MKNQVTNHLIMQALSLAEAKDKLATDLQDVLNRGRTIADDIAKWQTTQSLEDCMTCLPEATRPKIIAFPSVIADTAETALLQLNPLSRFALWVFSKKITDTRGQFRFKLGEGFVSRRFSEVCWCDSCLSREDKQKIAPALIGVCREHKITAVFLRLSNHSECTVSYERKRLNLFEALNCWNVFREEEMTDAKRCVFFDSVADESPFSKNIWLTTQLRDSDTKIQDVWRMFVN